MFQPTAETASKVLETSGALGLELDFYPRKAEPPADPRPERITLAQQVIGERLLALLSTLASQRASFDPGAQVLIAFQDQPYPGCPKKQRFTPQVEKGLTRRLGLVPAHAKYREALSELAKEFCLWARDKEVGFRQDEEGNTYLVCRPPEPGLKDLAAEEPRAEGKGQ
jgi:hypothetical protein